MSHAASIGHYIREIGRGKDGARALTRAQAADLFGLVLERRVTDLEIGAFCLAMRVKGETPDEMAGFIDATQARLPRLRVDRPSVVLPSYNGARKLPVLTPLLAGLLAREGVGVLVHGLPQDPARVTSAQVFAALGWRCAAVLSDIGDALQSGGAVFAPIGLLCPPLAALLQVRRVVGVRNSAHSVVKQMNPLPGHGLVVASHTHPEYAVSMARTFELTGADALLLRGTEGEPVADARRMPQLLALRAGHARVVQPAQTGALASLPELPPPDADATARYIRAVLGGALPAPAPIARQVECILHELSLMARQPAEIAS